MRKTYITPESEVIEMELSGVLAASNEHKEPGELEDAGAPEMAFHDDVDDYYDDEE